MKDSWYDTAQICLNGHVINEKSVELPERNKKFCDQCGAVSVTACQKCNAPIPGYYHEPDLIRPEATYVAPAFCHQCGVAYSWIESRLQASREIARELEGLTDEEKETLIQSLDDIVKDTPKTTIACLRLKKLFDKAGKGTDEMFREILRDFISTTARKLLWP
ncbi:MAG: DUF2321 domain-containing protein [Deltaproteobacteria bacterium]|nr:DUF2321 domain-containing protein [Deltaproteobacteria bacterium]MBW2307205.1 DUF2321 domain-containing protein [Deltaproteobacteria bacterium]